MSFISRLNYLDVPEGDKDVWGLGFYGASRSLPALKPDSPIISEDRVFLITCIITMREIIAEMRSAAFSPRQCRVKDGLGNTAQGLRL